MYLAFPPSMAEIPTFTPAQKPLAHANPPKPNIFFNIDTGWGMVNLNKDHMWVSEHYSEFGKPVCQTPNSTQWRKIVDDATKEYLSADPDNRQSSDLYDPFKTGKYVPFVPQDHKDAQGNPIYTESIPIVACATLSKVEMINPLLKNLIRQYADSAYIGVGTYGPYAPEGLSWTQAQNTINMNHIGVPITDLSKEDENSPNSAYQKMYDFIDKVTTNDYVLKSDVKRINNAPMLNAMYQMSLYFRGFPIGETRQGYWTDTNGTQWDFKQHKSPLKYRCTKNHVVFLTNGLQEGLGILPILKADTRRPQDPARDKDSDPSFLYYYPSEVPDNGKWVSDDGQFYTSRYRAYGWGAEIGNDYVTVGKMLRNYDIRNAKYHNTNNFPAVDAAGKNWYAQGSKTQNVVLNALLFNPGGNFIEYDGVTMGNSYLPGGTKGKIEKATRATKVGYYDYEVTDYALAVESMDTILRGDTIPSSSTSAFEDQYQRTEDTIRYKSHYNLPQRTGVIEAYAWDKSLNNWAKEPLWTTNQKVRGAQGWLRTMAYPKKGGTAKPYDAPMWTGYLYNAYNAAYNSILWDRLTIYLWGVQQFDHGGYKDMYRVNSRPVAMGSIVHSNLAYFAKDRSYLNLKTMSKHLQSEMSHFVLHRSSNFWWNLIITNSNDGVINLIHAEKGPNHFKSNPWAGQRYAGYFPGFLAQRLDEIALRRNPFNFTMDGPVNLFDFKHRGKNNDKFSTVGYSAMGAGGKGIAAYRIYETVLTGVDRDNNPRFGWDNHFFKPLFEISNEGHYKTRGFENLGYTYSDFEFFNRYYDGQAEGVAVFGNGWGNSVSSLYLINAYTGELLQEIILNNKGGGASSPAIVVERDHNGYQRIIAAYVGDLSGKLYKVEFNEDLTAKRVETLLKPANSYNPITVKPMLVKSGNDVWVYFGTGRNADEQQDRGPDSKVLQYIYGIKDTGKYGLTLKHLGKNTMKTEYNTIVNDSDHAIGTVSVVSKSKSQYGWYIPLNTDGKGERVVLSPARTDGSIVFSTWGNNEMMLLSEDDPYYDPCIQDEAFGKVFFLSLTDGQSSGTKRSSVVTKSVTPGIPTAPGIYTQSELSGGGDGLEDTVDEEIAEKIADEIWGNNAGLANLLGGNRGSRPKEEAILVNGCGTITGDDGQDITCIDVPDAPDPIPLFPKRISIQNLY